MATRATQQVIQYVADPSSPSDVRVTRVFGQALIAQGAIQATNSLGWVGTVAQGPDYVATAADVLGWTAGEDASYDPIFNIFVNQRLFNGTDSVEALYRAVQQTIFTDLASPDHTETIVQYLNWTERKFHDTGNTLGWRLGQSASEAFIATAENFWFTNPSENNKVLHAHNADNSLGWADTTNRDISQLVIDSFGWADVATFSGPQSRDVEQEGKGGGFLRQTVSVQVDNNQCRELEYDPVIGESDDTSFDSFTTTKPTFAAGTVELSYPVVAPTSTLTLADPDFGNSATFNLTRIDRVTAGGDRKIFTDQDWGEWERLDLSISELDEVTADEIIDFLNLTNGKKVRFDDWEGNTWNGIIVGPNTDVTKSRGGWNLQLIFEGEKV